MEFLKQFDAAWRISTPLVTIRTFDAKSTMEAIKTLFKQDAKPPIILWDVVNGLTGFCEESNGILAKALQQAGIDQIQTVEAKEALRTASYIAAKNGVDPFVFFSNAHLFWNEREVIQGIWNIRDIYKAKGNMLILLTQAGASLPTELTNDVLILDEPLPSESMLSAMIKDTYSFAGANPPDNGTVSLAVNALTGLPFFPAEQSTAMCLTVDKATKIGTLDIAQLWERKRQIINQTPGLEVWQGNDKLSDIGGLEAIKTYLCRVAESKNSPNVFIFLDEIEKAFAGTGTDTSGVTTKLTGAMLQWLQDKNVQGVILLGVPGAGKSQIAKAIGANYGKPVISFNLANMESGIVGSSQANLRQAIATVDAVSGGKVFAIATSNGIDALPAELLARFQDGTFFFDTPTTEEQASIWNIYREKYNIPDTQELPDAKGWTGREIKACVRTADNFGITLQDAAQYIVPITASQQDRLENLRRSSSGKYLSASKTGMYKYTDNSEPSIPNVPTGRKMRE